MHLAGRVQHLFSLRIKPNVKHTIHFSVLFPEYVPFILEFDQNIGKFIVYFSLV